MRTVLVCDTRDRLNPSPEFRAGWDDVIDIAAGPDDDSPADALVRELPDILDKVSTHERWLLWLELDWLLPPWHVPADLFTLYTDDLMEPEEPTTADEDEDDSPDDDEVESDDGEEPDDDLVDAEVAAEPLEPVEPLIPWTDPPTGGFDRHDIDSWELLHRTYAAAVTAVDSEMGRVFAIIRDRRSDAETAWVVTSDFGYPLGQHGFVGPAEAMPHEEFVHVPLIVSASDADAGQRVGGLTTPADLHSIITSLFTQTEMGDAPDRQTLTAYGRDAVISGVTIDGDTGYSLRTPDWTLILPPGEDVAARLYERPADRWEVNDVSARDRGVADELEARLREWLKPRQ